MQIRIDILEANAGHIADGNDARAHMLSAHTPSQPPDKLACRAWAILLFLAL
jgi:hypothetical protein